MKKILALLLALCMAFSMFSVVAFADNDEAVIDSYEEFIFNLALLEEIAGQYARENPGKNPIALVIKYIRTGVDRYNSGSWGIMAGYEDSEFAKYVKRLEDLINAEVTDGNYIYVSRLKDLKNFYLPNGDLADIGCFRLGR